MVINRQATEAMGVTRRRVLSNELEACIADYLSKSEVPVSVINFEDYCKLVDDDVLPEFCGERGFELSKWLTARDNKKTGYGNPDTTAMLGPVYCNRPANPSTF